jgi:hypothetical protein
VEAVEQKLKSARSYWHRQKWLIVYNRLVDPRPAAEVAKQTGVSVGREAELPFTRTDARKISASLLAILRGWCWHTSLSAIALTWQTIASPLSAIVLTW